MTSGQRKMGCSTWTLARNVGGEVTSAMSADKFGKFIKIGAVYSYSTVLKPHGDDALEHD